MGETAGHDAEVSFERWVSEYGARLHGTILETAFDEGFAVTHIGGGALALRKDSEDDWSYWLISDSTFIGQDLDTAAEDWIVGRYLSHDDSSQSAIIVEQKTCLSEALRLHETIPIPEPLSDGSASYVSHAEWRHMPPHEKPM